MSAASDGFDMPEFIQQQLRRQGLMEASTREAKERLEEANEELLFHAINDLRDAAEHSSAFAMAMAFLDYKLSTPKEWLEKCPQALLPRVYAFLGDYFTATARGIAEVRGIMENAAAVIDGLKPKPTGDAQP